MPGAQTQGTARLSGLKLPHGFAVTALVDIVALMRGRGARKCGVPIGETSEQADHLAVGLGMQQV